MNKKIKNILRCYAAGMGIKETASTFHTSRNTVRKYVRLFLSSGRSIDQLLSLSDGELLVIFPPTVVDKDRTLRGDYFKKPTGYWFVNCTKTFGLSIQQDKERKIIRKCKSAPSQGICSEERSLISSDYARNFICDFIIGREQRHTMKQLF